MTKALPNTRRARFHHHSHNATKIPPQSTTKMAPTEPFPTFHPTIYYVPNTDIDIPPPTTTQRRNGSAVRCGILRPTAASASVVLVEPEMNYRDGVPSNATIALCPTSPPHDLPCNHDLIPSRFPRHVCKCYVASAINAERFPLSEYPEVFSRIDQLVDDQMWESEENPHVSLRDVSGIRDSLDLARSKICFRCQEKKHRRRERWKPVGLLEKIRRGLRKRLGVRRRVCEKCKGYWR